MLTFREKVLKVAIVRIDIVINSNAYNILFTQRNNLDFVPGAAMFRCLRFELDETRVVTFTNEPNLLNGSLT